MATGETSTASRGARPTALRHGDRTRIAHGAFLNGAEGGETSQRRCGLNKMPDPIVRLREIGGVKGWGCDSGEMLKMNGTKHIAGLTLTLLSFFRRRKKTSFLRKALTTRARRELSSTHDGAARVRTEMGATWRGPGPRERIPGDGCREHGRRRLTAFVIH